MNIGIFINFKLNLIKIFFLYYYIYMSNNVYKEKYYKYKKKYINLIGGSSNVELILSPNPDRKLIDLKTLNMSPYILHNRNYTFYQQDSTRA
jgi:hypothetical protein